MYGRTNSRPLRRQSPILELMVYLNYQDSSITLSRRHSPSTYETRCPVQSILATAGINVWALRWYLDGDFWESPRFCRSIPWRGTGAVPPVRLRLFTPPIPSRASNIEGVKRFARTQSGPYLAPLGRVHLVP